MYLGSRAWPVREADNLINVPEPSRQCESLDVSQTYGPPLHIRGIAFLLLRLFGWSLDMQVKC
jgi:hypothetical protein